MGKIATKILADGNGWSAGDFICTFGPEDRPFEERHSWISIAVVVEGSFQYRSAYGSELMTAGSLLLGALGHCYECAHEHGAGDRCLSFHYTPEFFDRAGVEPDFRIHRIPPMRDLAPWIVGARLGISSPERTNFEEMAHGLAGAVLDAVGKGFHSSVAPTAADERRISAAVRFIEANLAEQLSLNTLASQARMSEFHFLRVFKQVMNITPHQYVLCSRLRRAAVRLKTSKAPVLDVAMDFGFRDLSNFNHAFRAEFGLNPSRFRNRNSGTRD